MKTVKNKRTVNRLRARTMGGALLFSLGAFSAAHAQFDSGAVLGDIKDPSGADVGSATVELLDVAKGVKVVRHTDSSGLYEFDSVQPGEYILTVVAPGFQSSKTDAFRVNVGARQRVDLALKVGGDSEVVTVTGAATQLETETSDRGQTVQNAEAVSLPLNGRSYADLAQLVPGVRRSLIATVASTPPRDASYNVNGLTSMNNNSPSTALTTTPTRRPTRAIPTRLSSPRPMHSLS